MNQKFSLTDILYQLVFFHSLSSQINKNSPLAPLLNNTLYISLLSNNYIEFNEPILLSSYNIILIGAEHIPNIICMCLILAWF